MAHSIVSGEKRLLLMPYGENWRRQRKIMHQTLGSSQLRIFKPIQDRESRLLMYQLLDQPQSWYLALGRFSNSVIMSVIFGHPTDPQDPTLSALYQVQEQFVPYTMPGASIVDTLPLLARIPFFKGLQPWRIKGDRLHERTTRYIPLLIFFTSVSSISNVIPSITDSISIVSSTN